MTKLVNKILESLLIVFVTALVLVCLWQVFSRYVLNAPSAWSEEFMRYALVWLTMLGVPYVYGRNQHIALTFVADTFDPKGKVINKFFIDIVVMVLAVCVFIIGGVLVSLNSAGQASPSLQLPMPVYYSALPVCGVLLLFYGLPRLTAFFTEYKNAKED